MKFKRAFKLMYNGEKIKLPSWGGYWYWDDEKKTVIMHTKEGQEMDIRETERVIYTLSNLLITYHFDLLTILTAHRLSHERQLLYYPYQYDLH